MAIAPVRPAPAEPDLGRIDGTQWRAPDGRHFPVEDGIVRMLGAVDPALAAELRAQEAALPLYLDERSLIARYERVVSRVAVADLLGGTRGTLLDVGCGVGLLGRLYPDLDLVGVDVAFPLLGRAAAGYRLRLECPADRLPFPDATFDGVLAVNMLHHVIEPAKAITEMARVLRPGGIFVAIDPRRVGVVEAAKRALRRGDAAYAESHRAFARDEYRSIVETGGALAIEELRAFGFFALLGAGGLDAVHAHRFLPTEATLAFLEGGDALVTRLGLRDALGLNLGVRARRRA